MTLDTYKLFEDENMGCPLNKVFCAKKSAVLKLHHIRKFFKILFCCKTADSWGTFTNVQNRIDMMKLFIEVENIYKILV